MKLSNLDTHKWNLTSQFGEDGVLTFILAQLPDSDKTCVEFGAWDGKLFSNTFHLIKNHGYGGVLIEADKSKHQELATTYKDNPLVTPICKFVGWSSNTLDEILSKTELPKNFDFLSIDIDGNDYHVWEACQRYTPKVVCIEYNPTIPTGVSFVQCKDPTIRQGASISSIVQLATEKGYTLVAVTRNNAIFVLNCYASHFPLDSHTPEALRTDTEWVTHLFFGVNGEVMVSGNLTTPWHGVDVRGIVRQLPGFLRGFPPEMPIWKRKLLGAYKKLCLSPRGYPNFKAQ
jgi:hypothetical protein